MRVKRSFSKETKQMLVEKYISGNYPSIAYAAKSFGVSRSSLVKWSKERGFSPKDYNPLGTEVQEGPEIGKPTVSEKKELKSPIVTDASYADVMVVGLKDNPAWSESTAMKLRALGVRTDSYVGEKGLGQQFAYAEKNGIPFVVTAQDGELYSVKEIATRKVTDGVSLEDIARMARGK